MRRLMGEYQSELVVASQKPHHASIDLYRFSISPGVYGVGVDPGPAIQSSPGKAKLQRFDGFRAPTTSTSISRILCSCLFCHA
jgi:hypothetical protein